VLPFDIQNGEKMREVDDYQSNNTGATFTAFLIGGLIGGALALLYAPRSGRETREFLLNEGQETADRVMDSIRDAQDNILTTIEEAQVRLEAMNQETRERLQRLQAIAQETIEEERQVFEKRYGQVKDAMKE
jgi:gas vesicle protein